MLRLYKRLIDKSKVNRIKHALEKSSRKKKNFMTKGESALSAQVVFVIEVETIVVLQ